MSTSEFDALNPREVDPLGGFFHPDWAEERKQKLAERNRSFLLRFLSYVRGGIVTYARSDEPNMSTGDIRLDVDPEEMRHPSPLSPQQEADKEAAIAAFKGVGPIETDFYDGLLFPKSKQGDP